MPGITTSYWNRLMPTTQRTVQHVFGQTVIYQQPGRPALSVVGHFDEAYELVELQGEAQVSSMRPVLDVVLSDFVIPPQEGDQVTIGQGVSARTFSVIDAQPDGDGGSLLILHIA